MRTDIEYTFNGVFYRLYPNTEAGIAAYNSLPPECEGGTVMAAWWPSFKLACKEAKLTVRKARKPSNALSLEAILAELDRV